ncbi:MAG: aroE [Osedax symbiont Rs2]|nr:MAG: aroE [Osedax symbiont Rs2]
MDKLDRYAVVGNPIGHSKSPSIHKMFAQQSAQQLEYVTKLVALDEFSVDVKRFFAEQGSGLNVTVPFKQQAWDIATGLSDCARLAGAVNTLWLKDGEIQGDNTDGIGLVRDLISNNSYQLVDKKVLILGAGGAVRGVLQPIIAQRPSSITIANRTLSKALQLRTIFADIYPLECCEYSQLDGPYDLIINGTSASLSNQLPPLADEIVGPDSCLYDMMYGSQTTVFNQWGKKLGAKSCIDGLGMLVEQAAESFSLWRGVRPETAAVIRSLRKELQK